jgi:hypothetical protein
MLIFTPQKGSVMKIGLSFSKPILTPENYYFSDFLWLIMGKIKCSLCLKKKQAKKLIFAPKIALRVERSDPAQNHKFRADFLNARLQCG